MNTLLHVYMNRRMLALVVLGFASGLPSALTGSTLQSWMTDAGVAVSTIGLFSLARLPYTLKFLWAPLVDRYVPPLLGRRRGWLVLTQVLLGIAILWMAKVAPSGAMLGMAAIAVAMASATQDVVADAYRADVLPPDERGAGAAVFVTGWRLGFLATGSGALILVGRESVSWPVAFALSAALLLPVILIVALSPEPPVPVGTPATLAEAVVQPAREFLHRRGALLILLFVILFKLPDTILDPMKTPYLQGALGVPKAVIGTIAQGLGLGASIVGALAGGVLVAKVGMWWSLWVFAILQAASNLGFLVLHVHGADKVILAGVMGFESFCSGLVSAGFVAFLMSQCDPRFSATQYAVLTSVMALPRDVGGAATGYLAHWLGWPAFFIASVLLAVPGMLLLIKLPTMSTTNRFEVGRPER